MKIITSKVLLMTGVMAAVMLGTTAVNAASITYILENNNIGYGTPGSEFVYVTIADDGNDIKFTVDANDSLFTELGNWGIQNFGFNIDYASGLDFSSFNILFPTLSAPDPYALWDYACLDPTLPGSSSVNNCSLEDGNNLDGAGRFDVEVFDGGQGRPEPLMFSITGVTGDTIDTYALASQDDNARATDTYFVAHVVDFETGLEGLLDDMGDPCELGEGQEEQVGVCWTQPLTSAWFAGGSGGLTSPPAAIPVPAAVWLFGSGLLGLAGVARRKRS